MKLKAPANMTGISIGGEEYTVVNGCITVPDGFDISILNNHGFDSSAESLIPPTPAEVAADAAAEADAAEAAFKAAKAKAADAAKAAKAAEAGEK